MAKNPDRITVLIVEDEALIRMMLADELDDAGLAAIEAGDADEALALLDAHPEIGVLFTDINMPGKRNGLDLARAVHARRPDIKLYFASGRDMPGAGAMPDGVFIAKPYNPGHVVRLIRESV